MSESVPPILSLWELEQKARQALEERARDHERWKREESWDQSVRDMAAMTLVVNALSAEVRDNCMKKATYSKPIKWFMGLLMGGIMVPACAWIWTFLGRLHIGPG